MVLSGCLTQFVGISGKPRIVTRCILTVSVTNILFALLFVFVFDSVNDNAKVYQQIIQ